MKTLLAFLLTTILFVTSAMADGKCGSTDELFKALLSQYQEKPAFVAAGNGGLDVTVTISPSGTWTMVVQHGTAACIIGAGDKWKVVPPPEIIPQSSPGLQEHGLILIHDTAAFTDPQRDSWYRSLNSKGGGSCCDLTDAAHIDQKYVRQEPDHSWEVFLTDLGKWVRVPADRVVTAKSIDGEPYLFRYSAKLWDGSLIRCFVPPIPGY